METQSTPRHDDVEAMEIMVGDRAAVGNRHGLVVHYTEDEVTLSMDDDRNGPSQVFDRLDVNRVSHETVAATIGRNTPHDTASARDEAEEEGRPAHYGGKDDPYEAIKVILAWDCDFLEGNVIKYLKRYKLKGGVVDLAKARRYLDWLIEREAEKG
jgi:hypothetical protein